MEQEKYEIVKFVDNGFEFEVNVSPSEDTVWLTQQQLALLFNTTKQNIGLHIKNILNEKELDIRTVKDFFTVQMEGNRFPSQFCFQLTEKEKDELVTNCDRLARLRHSSACPYAF